MLQALPAAALTADEARTFVQGVTDEMLAIVQASTPDDPRVEQFLELFRRTAALDAIGRFTLGPHWRGMTEAQQGAFLAAFERYASRVYANRVGDYNGQRLEIIGVQDVGRRGMLVRSRLRQPGAADIALDWLVSDRGGDTRIVDIVAEGVSLSIAQREEFAGMIERRGGDFDRFIRDLDTLG